MVCFVVHFHIWTLTHFHSTGVPAAWMLTSSSMEVTIQCFLNFIKLWSLEITPVIVMSDHDQGQLNAIKAVYPESRILLCWWHVLRAMRLYF